MRWQGSTRPQNQSREETKEQTKENTLRETTEIKKYTKENKLTEKQQNKYKQKRQRLQLRQWSERATLRPEGSFLLKCKSGTSGPINDDPATTCHECPALGLDRLLASHPPPQAILMMVR
jgi:hypothetical protein